MASVFIGDLDDFLAPAQSCVNPLFKDDVNSQKADEEATRGKAKITLDSLVAWEERLPAATSLGGGAPLSVKPDLIKATGVGKKAIVTLNDCLACSGCVTSAETVLISQQSTSELQRSLQEENSYRALAVALSPQSVASLAAYYQTSGPHAFWCLCSLFTRYAEQVARPTGRSPLPVHVYSTAAASDLALLESAAEFVTRYRQAKPVPWEPPEPSRAVSSTHTSLEGGMQPPLVVPNPRPSHETLPMLTSACPGWVCYAEKTTPAVIPYISTTKSPQQIMGSLVKQVLAPSSGLSAKEVLLVGIMPCYDKKLEASRKDFYHEEEDWGGVPEVDIVLTTGEVTDMVEALMTTTTTTTTTTMMEEAGVPVEAERQEGENDEEGHITSRTREWFLGLATRDPPSLDHANSHDDDDAMDTGAVTLSSAAGDLLSGLSPDGRSLLGPAAGEYSSSGGFLEYVYRHAARELFGVDVGTGPLTYVQGRNADYREVVLEVGGQVVLRFAQAYGFRNIQAVIQKVKRSRCPYHFVEVMACPSGCLNGGGQVKSAGAAEPPAVAKERLARVKAAFLQDRAVRDPREESPVVRWAYSDVGVAAGGPLGPRALQALHTRYHAVPKLEAANPMAIKW